MGCSSSGPIAYNKQRYARPQLEYIDDEAGRDDDQENVYKSRDGRVVKKLRLAADESDCDKSEQYCDLCRDCCEIFHFAGNCTVVTMSWAASFQAEHLQCALAAYFIKSFTRWRRELVN